jgi:ABC-type transporter Mla subunit MlaD
LIAQDEQLARRVGSIALALIGLAIAFFVFVYDRIEWGKHTRIRVYFHHAGSLHEGGAFVVGGQAIGKIESIALSPRGAPGPLNGDEGVVLGVAIDARDAARCDPRGDVFVASRGALAERYLELGPPPGDPSSTPGLREGEQLLGKDPPSLDRVLQRTWDNLTALAAFRDSVKPELDALRAQIAELRAHLDPASATAIAHADAIAPMFLELGGFADELRTLRDRGLGGDTGLAHLGEVLDRTRAVVASARGSLGKLDASATGLRVAIESLRTRLGTKGSAAVDAVELAIDRVKADIAKVDPLLAQVDALNQALARGDGTMMKLMHDPEFPEEAKELGKIMKRQPWKIIDRPSK